MFTRSVWNLSAPLSNSWKPLPHPHFTAFTIDSIMSLSDEAETTGLAVEGLNIIAENTGQVPNDAVYVCTKDPLSQQKGSQIGQSTTGNSDSSRQRWNGDCFQHRYTVSEQVHWLPAQRPCNLPHMQLMVTLTSLYTCNKTWGQYKDAYPIQIHQDILSNIC